MNELSVDQYRYRELCWFYAENDTNGFITVNLSILLRERERFPLFVSKRFSVIVHKRSYAPRMIENFHDTHDDIQKSKYLNRY
jgi:hypothetical protein